MSWARFTTPTSKYALVTTLNVKKFSIKQINIKASSKRVTIKIVAHFAAYGLRYSTFVTMSFPKESVKKSNVIG